VVSASGSGATVVPAPSVAAVGSFKSEDHLSTAFGLAALMQNGFAAGQAGLLKAGEQQQRWTQDAGAAEQQQPQLVQWTTGGKLLYPLSVSRALSLSLTPPNCVVIAASLLLLLPKLLSVFAHPPEAATLTLTATSTDRCVYLFLMVRVLELL